MATEAPSSKGLEEVRAALLRDASIPGLLAQRAARHPEKVAIAVAGEELTYAELLARVSALGGWLRGHRLGRGDRVLVAGGNSVNLLVSCLAAMWIGGVEVVANPGLTARELLYLVTDCEPAAVLADGEQLEKLADAVAHLPSACLDEEGSKVPGLVAGAAGGAIEPAELAPAGVASLQYTSGTTGEPKGARLTHGNLVSYLRAVSISWEWTADDVLLHSLPLSHGHGRNGVYTALLNGATAIVLARTEPTEIFATLRGTGATVFYAVPAIWERLLSAPDFDPAAFSGLRIWTSGSAPLSPDVSDRIAAALGSRPLERYGCTETGIVTTNPLRGRRFAGTVGLPVAGAEIRVADGAGDPLPDGEVGEVLVRGPSVFDSYWRREPADVFVGDGWFPTGDLGRFDAERDGHLVISGRSKELIISGGLNVYPREVELVAEGLRGVREAAALGIPSERWGEEVVLAVVLEDGSDPDDLGGLIAAMRDQLAVYKVPKQCKSIDSIPRNQTGKILRRELALGWERL